MVFRPSLLYFALNAQARAKVTKPEFFKLINTEYLRLLWYPFTPYV